MAGSGGRGSRLPQAAVAPGLQPRRSVGRRLPHAAIERQLALLPLYITGVVLTWQLVVLLTPPGARDAAGLPKGHDFVQFYALGSLAREGRFESLYDAREVNGHMWRLVPEARGDVFPPLYGPQVALFFQPFARLPYVDAVLAWLACSVVLYIVASAVMVSLLRRLRISRATKWTLLLLNPAFIVLLVAGQTTAVALLAVCGAWWLLALRRPMAAGLALGVLAYKPQLLVGPLAVLLLAAEWRVLAGVVVASILQGLVSAFIVGGGTLVAYAAALSGPVLHGSIPEPLPEQVHGFAGFWRLLVGPGLAATVLYGMSSVASLAVARHAWRRSEDPSIRMTVFILVAVLTSPHLYVYDLLLLAPALGAMWLWGESAPGRTGTLALALIWVAWLCPITGPIALATRVQPSAPVLAGLLLLLARGARADIPGDVRP